MGMGLLFAALSGAGKSIAKSAEDYQKSQDENALIDKKSASELNLMQERAKLEEEKQLRIDEITRGRNEAPLNRLGQSVSRFAGEEVPVEAAPVRTTTSAGAKAAGLQDGLVGMTRDQVKAYNDPDMLAQYDKQIEADQGIAQKGLLGKTRKRTSDEAMQAARDERVAAGDLQAVEAGDKANAVNVASKRQQAQDERNIRQDETSNRKIDAQEAYNKRREDRMDTLAEMQLAHQKAQGRRDEDKATAAEIKEQRAATSKALDGVNADIRSMEKEAADPMAAPEKKAVIDRQLAQARAEAKKYRAALAGAGLDAPEESKADPYAVPRRTATAAPQQDKKPPEKARQGAPTQQAQSKPDGVDVSADPVLGSLRQAMTGLDPRDPSNSEKIIAYGKAKNDRIKYLQEKYGPMTNLIGL